MDEQSRPEALRESLWALDRQTRRAIGMDPTALLDRSQLTPEERELADRFASDGGQRPSEDRGATDVEDTRDPGASEAMDAGAGHDGDGGDGDDEGSAFDVDGYGLRNKVGLVLGPLLFAAILLAPSPRGSRRPARPSARRPPGSRPGGSPRRSRSPRPPCYRSSSSRRPALSTSTRRPLPMPVPTSSCLWVGFSSRWRCSAGTCIAASRPRGDRRGAHPRVHPLSGARRHAHGRAGRAIGVARWPHPARGRRGRGHRSPLLSRRPRGRYRSRRGLCERDARDEQGDLRSVGAPHRNFALGIKQVGVTAGSAISAVVVTGLAGP